MKNIYLILISNLFLFPSAFSQNDSSLFKQIPIDTSSKMNLNVDAIYNRPFLNFGKSPVTLGGYFETNFQHISNNGITEGLQFQARRLTLFVASSIRNRIKFLCELEFEDGTKEISLEFAALDVEFNPLLNLRAGIILNPIGAFNQNHDGPKWEFIDRPISATQLLPATWSNAGFGLYGKKYSGKWAFSYELYLSNGFDDKIISNESNRTDLSASKKNTARFEESSNGEPLYTGKISIKNKKYAELGFSYMGGVYNKFEIDGLAIDKKRGVHVFAIDFNSTLPKLNTYLVGEWAWVFVDVPKTYTQQYGRQQQGGFLDIVQAIIKRKIFGFDNAVINIACRLEYVDWNVGNFNETGGNIAENIVSISPAISFRTSLQTVFRLNFKRSLQTDLFGNPPSLLGGFQFGLSSYF